LNRTTNSAQRPIGATLLSLMLGWLAISGFGNAVVWRAARSTLQVPSSSPIAGFLDATSSPVFTLIAIAYGVTALAACIGLWRVRDWMASAFLVWGLTAIGMGIWLVFAIPAEVLAGGSGVGIVSILLTAGLIGAGYVYVRRIAPSAASA
jgi:hypothetical protein